MNLQHLAIQYGATRKLRQCRQSNRRVAAALAKQEAAILSTLFFGD
jgi:hypothetical protein